MGLDRTTLHAYNGVMVHLHAREPRGGGGTAGRGDGETAGAPPRDVDLGKFLPYEALQFPGCRRISLTREEFENFDDRIEYWDAGAETAWVVADNYADRCQPAARFQAGRRARSTTR